VFGALQSVCTTYAFLALSDADVLESISRGFDSDAALAKELSVAEEREMRQ
jgi:hypothetical protein